MRNQDRLFGLLILLFLLALSFAIGRHWAAKMYISGDSYCEQRAGQEICWQMKRVE